MIDTVVLTIPKNKFRTLENTQGLYPVWELQNLKYYKYVKNKSDDPSYPRLTLYKRKIDDFEFAKDEREKVKEIYTVFNYDGKLQIFLIEVKSLSVPFVKYLTKRLSDRYLKFLIILTTDYKEYTFVFP